jgi:hypothetical protein
MTEATHPTAAQSETGRLLARLHNTHDLTRLARAWRDAESHSCLQSLLSALDYDACAQLNNARYSTVVAPWPAIDATGWLTWTYGLALVRWTSTRGAVLAARPATATEQAQYDPEVLRDAGYLAEATEHDRTCFTFELHDLLRAFAADMDETTDGVTRSAALLSA